MSHPTVSSQNEFKKFIPLSQLVIPDGSRRSPPRQKETRSISPHQTQPCSPQGRVVSPASLLEFIFKFGSIIQSGDETEFTKYAEMFLTFATEVANLASSSIQRSMPCIRSRQEKDVIFNRLDRFVREHRFAFQANCNLIGGCFPAYIISGGETEIYSELEILECQGHVGSHFAGIGEYLDNEGWVVSERSKGDTDDVLSCETYRKTGEMFVIKVVRINPKMHNNILHYVNHLDFDIYRSVWSPFDKIVSNGAQSTQGVSIEMTHPDIVTALKQLYMSKKVVLYPSRNTYVLDVMRNSKTGNRDVFYILRTRTLREIVKFKAMGLTVEIFPTPGFTESNMIYDLEEYISESKRRLENFNTKQGHDMRNAMGILFGIAEYYLESGEIAPTKNTTIAELVKFQEIYSQAYEMFGNGEKRFEPYYTKREQEEERRINNESARLLYSRPDLAVHGNNGIWDKIKAAASAAKAKVEEVKKRIQDSTAGQAVGAVAKAASSAFTSNAFRL